MTDARPLCRFHVPGRPVPWKAPTITKGRGGRVPGFSDPRMKGWQEAVRWHARAAMAGRPAVAGPVGMRLAFTLARGPLADLTNLVKATEDALQGAVFANDRQVAEAHVTRAVGPAEGVHVEVWGLA